MSVSLQGCEGSSLASEGSFAMRDMPLCLNESLLQKLAIHAAKDTMDCGTGARRVNPRCLTLNSRGLTRFAALRCPVVCFSRKQRGKNHDG